MEDFSHRMIAGAARFSQNANAFLLLWASICLFLLHMPCPSWFMPPHLFPKQTLLALEEK